MKYKIKTKHLKRIVKAAEKNEIKSIRIHTRKNTLAHPNENDAIEFVLKSKTFFDFVEFGRKGKNLITDLLKR